MLWFDEVFLCGPFGSLVGLWFVWFVREELRRDMVGGLGAEITDCSDVNGHRREGNM